MNLSRLHLPEWLNYIIAKWLGLIKEKYEKGDIIATMSKYPTFFSLDKDLPFDNKNTSIYYHHQWNYDGSLEWGKGGRATFITPLIGEKSKHYHHCRLATKNEIKELERIEEAMKGLDLEVNEF